ncbi:nucleoside 2-deoxyribosyltransferase [Streptomyces sp. URMC 126]|uniref:nucleoside 2-deoxyribosyltransferase n=1 Tax=Streptomyces sp. URMC 126 TaxID=3423401 RepID=UPI003F1E1462
MSAPPNTSVPPVPPPGAPEPGADFRSVFLAGPFLGLLDRTTGEMPPDARTPFDVLIEHFESQGLSVHNAHRREAWGARLMRPEECTPIDQEEIRKADVFVALPGSPASPGTHIEVGWASAFDKPVVLILEPGREYTFLIQGLHTVATVEYVVCADVAAALPAVDRAVRRAVARCRERDGVGGPLPPG